MKLSILSENITGSLLGTGIVGRSNLESDLIQALGPKMFKTQRANVQRLPSEQEKELPYRSGNQGTTRPEDDEYWGNVTNAAQEAKAVRPTKGVEVVGETDLESNDPLAMLDGEDQEPWKDDDAIFADDSDMKVR
jgi:hypothetical protein